MRPVVYNESYERTGYRAGLALAQPQRHDGDGTTKHQKIRTHLAV